MHVPITLRYDPMVVADDRRGAMVDVRTVKDRHSSLSSAWRRREAVLQPAQSFTLSDQDVFLSASSTLVLDCRPTLEYGF